MNLEPLLFAPVYKSYVWGGKRIAAAFKREGTPMPCAESWEVSAHPDGESVVEGGAFAGRTLSSLCEEFGTALLGSFVEGNRFPLLVKLIDADARLSVQVHPNDESAERYGGEAKTEMWYFLDAAKDGIVCAGLKKGVGPRIFQDAVKEKRVATLLNAVKVEPGKALYIPGGLVHAICEGCFVLEVQQNSNTTYRVYDWDRVGADGKPRELHVQKALEVINWKSSSEDGALCTPYAMTSANKANKRERVVRSDFFTMERFTLTAPEVRKADGTSFHILFAAKGAVKVAWADHETTIPNGRSALIPATLGDYTIAPVDATAVALHVEM